MGEGGTRHRRREDRLISVLKATRPMSNTITLTAKDGYQLAAYEVLPDGPARGSLVLIQEIFGVNHHIRAVCDRFAAEGYRVVSPALFDRVERDVDLGYSDDDRIKGRALLAKLGWPEMLMDTEAAMQAAAGGGRLGVVGYCLGGSLAWFAATRLAGASAAVCYYGAQIPSFAEEQPKCPVLMHFGEQDQGIPIAGVENVREQQRGAPVEIYVYPGAGHGFSCDERASFNEASHELAYARTLAFVRKHVGGLTT
jgi:carboxymethylenebutenolidase